MRRGAHSLLLPKLMQGPLVASKASQHQQEWIAHTGLPQLLQVATRQSA